MSIANVGDCPHSFPWFPFPLRSITDGSVSDLISLSVNFLSNAITSPPYLGQAEIVNENVTRSSPAAIDHFDPHQT